MLVMLVLFSARGRFAAQLKDSKFLASLVFRDNGYSIGNACPMELNNRLFLQGREVVDKSQYEVELAITLDARNQDMLDGLDLDLDDFFNSTEQMSSPSNNNTDNFLPTHREKPPN